MIQYAIRLRNSSGQKGWFMMIGDGVIITPEPALAARCRSEADAEDLLSTLVLEHGLNRDEAKIDQLAVEEEFTLKLGDGDWPDLIEIGVDEHSGAKYMLVRDSGEESSVDIPREIADLLVRVLSKVKKRINPL